jgi:hypothetical protein
MKPFARFYFIFFIFASLLASGSLSAQLADNDLTVLPFAEPPSASTTGKTLAESKHQWRKAESHLPKDAPNIC